MPKAKLVNMAGEQIGEYELSEAVFGIEPNRTVLHSSVVNYLANQRQGTQSALTKGEVSYTTRKPWRQKGTGRARAGYAGSPVWRHGGVAFAPKYKDQFEWGGVFQMNPGKTLLDDAAYAQIIEKIKSNL